MKTLKRLAKSPAFWIAVSSLAASLGINMPDELKQQLPIIGPMVVG